MTTIVKKPPPRINRNKVISKAPKIKGKNFLKLREVKKKTRKVTTTKTAADKQVADLLSGVDAFCEP